MTIPKIALHSLDTVQHSRRVAESINNIVTHEYDDWRRRTAAEVSAGVTPTNYAYQPGDVRRYGAATDGMTDDAPAVHRAISTGYAVLLPRGVTYAPSLNNTMISTSLRIFGEGGAVLDCGDTGFFDLLNAGGSISEVIINGVEIRNCGGHVVRCFSGEPLTPGLSFTTIERFTFEGNYVHDCNSGIYLACKVNKLIVRGNRFENLVAATSGCFGVSAGGNYFPEETFVDADVNTGSDRISLTDHVFTNAQQVRLNNIGGALPAGLALNTDYYVKVIDSDTVELYSDVGLTSIVDITAAAGGGDHYIFDADPDAIDDLEDFVVESNYFDGIDAQTNSVESHAVLLYGRNGVIANNVVKNVVNSGNGVSAEGIYTKMRYVAIIGNVLVDAGTGEGYIAVKGNPPVPRAGNKSPPAKGALVQGNVLTQTNGVSEAHTGVFCQSYGVSVVGNHFDGLGGSCVETQNQWQLNEIEISGNMVRRHRGARVFYIRHYGDNFCLNDNLVAEYVAHSGLSDVSMIELAGTANQGDWDGWEICRNQLRDAGTCEASTRLRCISIAVNTGNTATGLRIAGNTMQNQQPSIDEVGLSISTGTYVQLVVENNDAQRVDGSSGLAVFGTITSAWFADNLFTAPFDNGSTDVEWRHVNRIHTNRTAGGSGRTYTLPAAVPGMEYTFARAATGTMDVDPDGTDQIRGTTGAGDTATLDAVGSCLTLRCETAGFWTVVSANGVTLT